MTLATARACGKVILLGEHFVVPHADSADAPAIALPLHSVSCEVSVEPGPRAFRADDVPPEVRVLVEKRMEAAVDAAASALAMELGSMSVRSRATLPISRGFGSSAAFSVALTRALAAFARWTGDLTRATHAVETVFHGAPSGLDTAVILAERAIRFHRGRLERYVANDAVSLVAVDSGPRDGASALIAKVRELRGRSRECWARMALRMTELVDRCEVALARSDARTVGEIASAAHGMLAELGLTQPSIEKVLADARDLGALGGKVSGAGAGGAVVLVTRTDDGERLAAAMRGRGHHVVAVTH